MLIVLTSSDLSSAHVHQDMKEMDHIVKVMPNKLFALKNKLSCCNNTLLSDMGTFNKILLFK